MPSKGIRKQRGYLTITRVSSTDRWDEKYAEKIVARHTGGITESRDVPGAPPGTHDFDVVLLDGRVFAVEATLHVDRKQQELRAAIRKRGGWTFPELGSSWYLLLSPAARASELYVEIEALLGKISPGFASEPDGFQPPTGSRLHKLGVRRVRKLPHVQPPEVICEVDDDGPSPVDFPDGRTLAATVKQLAARKAQKLARANADERHLFAWIDFFEEADLADLGRTGLPAASPDLHATVDAVWIAEAFSPGRVVSYTRRDGWTDRGKWSVEE